MTTKLDEMVRWLAGRTPEGPLLEEIDDPSSEARRFLEATRTRSRSLLRNPFPAPDAPTPRPAPSARGRSGLVLMALGGLVVVTLAAWLVVARSQRLEALMGRSEAEASARFARLEAAIDRLSAPRPAPVVALGPIEAALKRLETAERPADPLLAEVVDGLVGLRRDLASREKLDIRRFEELQAADHEVARLLRLVLARTQPVAPPIDPGQTPTPRPPASVETRRVPGP